MGSTIAATDLSKWYGSVVALNHISVEIAAGITGILGPNGSGKTTFLRLACGLTEPSSGRIAVCDANPWRNRALYRRLAFVPAHESTYPFMTAREFISMVLTLNGRSSDFARTAIAEIIEKMQLQRFIDKKIATCSRGMKQQTKIAAALALKPEIMVLDEPLQGCDPHTVDRVIEVLNDFRTAGNTILFSSHILEEVSMMTENIVVFYKGCVLASGNVAQIRALLHEYPLSVRVICTNPEKLAERVIAEKAVTEIHFEDGNVLAVKTTKAESFFACVTAGAARGDFKITEMEPIDEDMEAVFNYLIISGHSRISVNEVEKVEGK